MAMIEEKKRKQLIDIINGLPAEKLPEAYDFFIDLFGEEPEEINEQDKKDIQEAIEEYKKGEAYSFDEVFGEDE